MKKYLLLFLLFGFSECFIAQTALRARVKKGDKWGLIDEKGKEVLKPKYSSIEEFSEGLAKVELNKKFGFIDANGKVIIPLVYQEAGTFREGLVNVKDGNYWGYIDKTGKIIIPFNYEGAEIFSEGLAAAMKNGKWGYIEKNGNWKIRPKYELAQDFFLGYGVVQLNNQRGVINTQDSVIIPLNYYAIIPQKTNLFWVSNGAKKGYATKNIEWLIKMDYDYLGYFIFRDSFYSPISDFIVFKKGNVFGFFNKYGALIKDGYTDMNGFSENLASVQLITNEVNRRWGYIDTTGTMIIPAIYDNAVRFSEGLAGVELNNFWGFIDTSGKVAIPIMYSNASNMIFKPIFRNGYAIVSNEKEVLIIDKNNKRIKTKHYDTILYMEKLFFSK